jgi:hypothetical protein
MHRGKTSQKLTLRKWWLILGIVILFLRLPSCFEPFTYGDEGIYLTLGQAIRKGLTLYKEIHDNKPPLLYLLAALAGNFSYYRAILFFWSLITIYFFYKLSILLFKNKNTQIISTFIFTILTSIRTFEGNIGNAENFMILPTLGGFYLLLKAKKWQNYFFAGVLFSLATLFKVPAAFDFAAALFFTLILFLSKKNKNYSSFIIHCSLFICGFLLPILATFVYYASKNALSFYLSAAFFQNLPYLSSWTPDKPKVVSFPLPLILRAFLLGGILIFVFLSPKKLSLTAKLILIWFPFSLFAALLSSRPYPHYLLQAIPPLALGWGLVLEKNSKERIIPLVFSLLLTFSFFWFKFWHYPNFSYYVNFYQFAFGQKPKEEYFNYFSNQAKFLYQTSTYLKLHTTPEQKIFLWGNQPSVYALADRLPATRFIVAYHIIDFNGYEETIKTLKQNPPAYVIISNEEKRPFKELFFFLQDYYFSTFKFGGFTIFKFKK